MFVPHTESDREAMLRTVGVNHLDDLFQDVPAKHRFPELDLPPGISEMEAISDLSELSAANETVRDLICFLGAGAYHHYVPAAVDQLLLRGEFFTAYTPYQPEISQGTLRAIFDYQSLITALTGMDVSNASHYDGATSAAEAITLADAHFRGNRSKVVLSPAIHPQYVQVIKTYHHGTGIEIEEGKNLPSVLGGPEALYPLIDEKTSLVMVQYPDFFGHIYDYAKLAEVTHQAGALFAVSVNPLALGLLTPPGDFGADIVTGEGQPLGIPLSYGGPYLGIFATKQEFVRRMAGRLVGETVDANGNRGYVLTLTTREQHIRREKATSNICTNQGLMALASTIYMSLLGKHGLRQVAELCYQKAHYAAASIAKVSGFKVYDEKPFFHEFIVQCPKPVDEVNEDLLDYGILGGYDLGKDFPELENCMLVAVTEMIQRDDIDLMVDVLEEVSQ